MTKVEFSIVINIKDESEISYIERAELRQKFNEILNDMEEIAVKADQEVDSTFWDYI